MSNVVTIKRTKFSDPYDQNSSFGFRIYDNDAKDYCNDFETSDEIPGDDLELLKFVKENSTDIISDMLEYCVEYEAGIEIDGNWYSYDQIEGILE